MRYVIAIAFFCRAILFAQQVVTPTPDTTENPRGDSIGDYNVRQSFETGERFESVTGNETTYRSNVNFGNGPRLLAGDIDADSKDGNGLVFDQLTLKMLGLGNDPYESVLLRVEKNRWYDYSLNWRLSDYVNPGLTTANGTDAENLQRRIQDHDLVLLPQSKIRFMLGYSRNTEDGPALTTSGFVGEAIPLFQNVHRTQDEYRVGLLANVAGFRISLLHVWEFYRDDSPIISAVTQRLQPDHGETPGWRLFVARDLGRTLAFNGRLTYQGTGHGTITDEHTISPFATAPQQFVISGEASRPATAANVNLIWSPLEKLSFTNQTSYDPILMNGNDVYREFDDGTLTSTVVNFQFLGIRRISDATDVNYQATRWLGLTGGYEFSTRRFRSVVATSVPNAAPDAGAFEQTNTLHAGRGGFRLRPMKRLTLTLNGEAGHNSRPIYPVSQGNYHAFNARAQYKAGSLLLAVTGRVDYNVNSVSISSFSSHVRMYGAEASWSPLPWFSFDATVSKLHTNTAGGLFFFADNAPVTGTQSLYISNLWFGNAGVRLAAGKHADLYVGYSRVQDTGDGRATPNGAGTHPIAAFDAVQTYPLLYETPLARLSIPLAARVRFNLGWQYYRYQEVFLAVRNYHANTGYTSLTWSF